MKNKAPKFIVAKLSLVLLAWLLCHHTVLSQTIPSEEVTVVAAYEPSLSDAHKINFNPQVPEPEVKEAELVFNVNPQRFTTFYEPEKISAARLRGEPRPLTYLYRSYVKAGFGNYTTPFAELYYNNLRSRVGNMGLYLKHHSSSGEIIDYAPARFSDNIVNIYGSRFTRNHILSGDMRYERNRINYYGFNPDNFLIDEDRIDDLIHQRFQNIELSASAKSNYSASDRLNHSFGLKYYNLNDIDNIKENSLAFRAHINKSLQLIPAIDNEQFALDFNMFYYNNAYLLESVNAFQFEVKPGFLFKTNQYSLNVGINASIEAAENDYIHFFPIIKGQIAVAESVLSIFGELSGGQKRNNLKDLYEENPFINTSLPLKFTTEKVKVKGGIKGNVASVLSFTIGGAFSETENSPFFVTDTTNILHNRFTLSYHDMTHTRVFADFAVEASENLSFMLRGNFNYYDLDTEKHAWHKPMFDGHLITKYNLVDKIFLNGEIFGQSKTYAKVFDSEGEVEAAEIKAFLDANIGIEYRYTQRVSAFLNVMNLTASRYYRWFNYPTQRFHILAGLTYAF